MVYENPASVEKRIKRLKSEIEEIDKFFYRYHEHNDRVAYMGMLERKRDDIVRSAVLQLHTSVEDLVTQLLFTSILGPDGKRRRTKRGQALERMLTGGAGLGFDRKLNLAVVAGVITPKTQSKLRELNTVRNRCSHNWLLDVAVRRGKKNTPMQKKPRLLSFRGRDLHKLAVLKDFAGEYGLIYVRLFAKSLD